MIAVSILLLTVFSIETRAKIIGSITTLPPTNIKDISVWPTIDGPASCVWKNNELHTWSQWAMGQWLQGAFNVFKLRLEWSVLGGDNYIVTLYYNTLILDKAMADRIDGELTQSVSVQSTGPNQQIVKWLMPNNECKKRTYHTKNEDGQWSLLRKVEETCPYPSYLQNVLSTLAPNRKNYWFWGDKPLSSWNMNAGFSNGFWGGSVVNLPSESGISSVFCQDSYLLHTWTHFMAKGYKLLLYRFLDDRKRIRLHIEIRYEDMILDSGMEVTRFDDEMLTSVTIVDDQTKDKENRPIKQTDNFQVAYKMTNGECLVRVYKMQMDKEKKPLNRVTYGWETRCKVLYQQNTYFRAQFQRIENQNGWVY